MRRRFGCAIAQFEGARIQGSDFRRASAFGGNQRGAQGKQEFQLALALRARIGKPWNQREASAHMSDRFAILGALAGAQPRGKPARDRPLGDAGLGPVMRDELGGVARRLRKAALQHFGNSQVQLAPTAAQEAFIGHLLHQRMLEYVA